MPEQFILEVWLVMAMAREHQFQILTKRPERMREILSRQFMPPGSIHKLFSDDLWPLPNVWIGTSVENQHCANVRIPPLLHTPARVRFLSVEPMLGPVDLTMLAGPEPDHPTKFREYIDAVHGTETDWMGFERKLAAEHDLHWVIVGGESGPKHRPMDLAWVGALREQCRAAGVAYFGKQNSGVRPGIKLPGELGDREWPQ